MPSRGMEDRPMHWENASFRTSQDATEPYWLLNWNGTDI